MLLLNVLRMRICENCGKELVNRRQKKYCSKKCFDTRINFNCSFGGVIEYGKGLKRTFWLKSDIKSILIELEKLGVKEVKLRFNERT